MKDYFALTKPRITVLILICTAVGYWFGRGSSFRFSILAYALVGTALLASGTSALNQRYEADAISSGCGLLYFGARLGRERTLVRARGLLLASVLYLPALLGVMVLDSRVL
jgi:heme o synthase